MRLGLVEASQNKIGNAGDQVLLYCYHYDPATGKYGAIVSRVLQLWRAAGDHVADLWRNHDLRAASRWTDRAAQTLERPKLTTED